MKTLTINGVSLYVDCTPRTVCTTLDWISNGGYFLRRNVEESEEE